MYRLLWMPYNHAGTVETMKKYGNMAKICTRCQPHLGGR